MVKSTLLDWIKDIQLPVHLWLACVRHQEPLKKGERVHPCLLVDELSVEDRWSSVLLQSYKKCVDKDWVLTFKDK